jgi:hypothetical protein
MASRAVMALADIVAGKGRSVSKKKFHGCLGASSGKDEIPILRSAEKATIIGYRRNGMGMQREIEDEFG